MTDNLIVQETRYNGKQTKTATQTGLSADVLGSNFRVRTGGVCRKQTSFESSCVDSFESAER